MPMNVYQYRLCSLIVKGGAGAAAVGVGIGATGETATATSEPTTTTTTTSTVTSKATSTAATETTTITTKTTTASTTEASARTATASTATAKSAVATKVTLGAGSTGLGKVKADGTAVDGLSVHGIHTSLGSLAILELDVAVTLGAARLAISDDTGINDTSAGSLELLLEPVTVNVKRETSDEEGSTLGLAVHGGTSGISLGLLGSKVLGRGGTLLGGLLFLRLFLLGLSLRLGLAGGLLGDSPGLARLGLGLGSIRVSLAANLVTVRSIRVDTGLVTSTAGIRVSLAGTANLRLGLGTGSLRLGLAALIRRGLFLLGLLGGHGNGLLELGLGLDNILGGAALLGNLIYKRGISMDASYTKLEGTLVSGLVMSERERKMGYPPPVGRGSLVFKGTPGTNKHLWSQIIIMGG